MTSSLSATGVRGVIIIDDDRDLGLLLERWLHSAGHRAFAFTDPTGALTAIASAAPLAVLLDLQLPGTNESDVLIRIRRQHPHVPVIVISGDDDPAAVRKAMSQGAADFLVKPLERNKLLTTLRNALDRAQLAVRVAHLEQEVTRVAELPERDEQSAIRTLVREIGRVLSRVEGSEGLSFGSGQLADDIDEAIALHRGTGVPPARLPRPAVSLAARERESIAAAIRSTGGNLSKASKVLGIGRTTLYRKLAEYQLR